MAKTLNSFDIKEMYTDRMDNFTRQFGALIFSGRLHLPLPLCQDYEIGIPKISLTTSWGDFFVFASI